MKLPIRGWMAPFQKRLKHDTRRRQAMRRPQALWLSRRLWRRRIVFWMGAIATGLISAGFAALATRAQILFNAVLHISILLPLLITPLGFAGSAWLCRKVFPGAQGSGIPQAIAARHTRSPADRNALLSLRLTLGKIVLTVFGLACGASIGREGPTVQVGASIMMYSARWSGMGREGGLILAGSAAGVAAAFNTPLAGIVFAIEEMSRSFEQRTSGVVLTTVILAGVAAQAFSGNHSYFGRTSASLDPTFAAGWVAVAIIGLVGGLLGAVFSRSVIIIQARLRRFIATQPVRRSILVAGSCGLIVAIGGIASGGLTYGTGYEQAQSALAGTALPWSFAPLKLLVTLASSVSGIPGGLFAPSLAVGTGIGSVLAPWLPSVAPGALAVLGMAGYFAGVVQAPITSFVIIMEMTDDHTMVVPLMASALIGYGVSRLFSPPLYHTLALGFMHPAATPDMPVPPASMNVADMDEVLEKLAVAEERDDIVVESTSIRAKAAKFKRGDRQRIPDPLPRPATARPSAEPEAEPDR